MSITEQDVKKIAKLSRIRLNDEEVTKFQSELSTILQWVEQLQELETDDVPMMTSVSHSQTPLRADEIGGDNKQDEVLANAPQSKYGCYVVPKVVE